MRYIRINLTCRQFAETITKEHLRMFFFCAKERKEELLWSTHFPIITAMRGEQYAFYRLPKALISDSYFKHLSIDAKLLYGLMLDRLSLSMMNGWIDEENKVYIYFTLEDICELLNCKTDKAVKLLAELDTNKGIGLIERVKQGQGKPTKIYVKKFVSNDNYGKNSDAGFAEVKTTENQKSGLRQKRNQDFGFSETNKTENNKPELSNKIDKTDEIDEIRQAIHAQIEYDILAQEYGESALNEIAELMLEVYCTEAAILKIGKRKIPTALAKERLQMLNSAHIEYIFESLRASPANIKNIKAYLLECLFNAPATMKHYYQAKVSYHAKT